MAGRVTSSYRRHRSEVIGVGSDYGGDSKTRLEDFIMGSFDRKTWIASLFQSMLLQQLFYFSVGAPVSREMLYEKWKHKVGRE